MRQYKSFDEIDRDLKLLKFQREIDKEKIILSYHLTRDSLRPSSIFKSMAGSIFKSAIVLKVAGKILSFIKKINNK